MSFSHKKDVKAELCPLDHRDLNNLLNYFHSDEAIGAGLPLWLSGGAVIREELEKLMKELEFQADYQRVVSPQIAKEELYLQSGHLPYYEDSMYPAIELENVRYRLRPMCCPHHHRIFGSELRSYRDLPLRLAEFGQVYRYERSGVLSGLMRVRGLCQNDAHIYCRKSQAKEEVKGALLMHQEAYRVLGISDYSLRLSKFDPDSNKYVPMLDKWKWAEGVLRDALLDLGFPFYEAADEAAFYGPKIDVQVQSIQGKDESASSVQLDFVSGERFDLSFVNENGEKEVPMIVHRAPLGSHERMVAFLIEKYQGNFPLWLSPIQVQILPIADRHVEYAQKIKKLLKQNFIRVEMDDRLESLGRKVADAKLKKAKQILVIGDREVESGMLGLQKVSEAVYLEELLKDIRSRKL